MAVVGAELCRELAGTILEKLQPFFDLAERALGEVRGQDGACLLGGDQRGCFHLVDAPAVRVS